MKKKGEEILMMVNTNPLPYWANLAHIITIRTNAISVSIVVAPDIFKQIAT